eukprot:444709-Rhodomonas_salina.1
MPGSPGQGVESPGPSRARGATTSTVACPGRSGTTTTTRLGLGVPVPTHTQASSSSSTPPADLDLKPVVRPLAVLDLIQARVENLKQEICAAFPVTVTGPGWWRRRQST